MKIQEAKAICPELVLVHVATSGGGCNSTCLGWLAPCMTLQPIGLVAMKHLHTFHTTPCCCASTPVVRCAAHCGQRVFFRAEIKRGRALARPQWAGSCTCSRQAMQPMGCPTV